MMMISTMIILNSGSTPMEMMIMNVDTLVAFTHVELHIE